MRKALSRYGRWAIVIVALMAVGVTVGGYILVKQRLQIPFQDRFSLRADFTGANGLTPGLGQPVNVSGVRVGTITGVELKNGLARVKMDIDPKELPAVRRGASATLVPRTPLKDMIVELDPGRPPAPELAENSIIPVRNTVGPIDSDELTAALDADTRDYFELLVAAGSTGVDGRGRDLRELFKALGPTARQLRELNAALDGRRQALARMIHSLSVVGQAVAERDDELGQTVDASNVALGAIADEEAALRESLRKLPGTLAVARSSLDKATDFANELAPAARELLPAARLLPGALAAAAPLVSEAEPILRTQLRPLVRELQPLARDLTPAARSLSAVTPELVSAFRVLNKVVNGTAYNPPGDWEGYLYWLAWFAHNSNSFLSTADANGSPWRGLALLQCSQLSDGSNAIGPLLNTLLGPLFGC